MQRLVTTLALAWMALVVSLPAQIWTLEAPATSPSPRRAGAAAFDPINGVLMAYGALLTPTAINNESWTYDGVTWNLLAPATAPPPRWGHRMVWDSARQRMVTFGGRSPSITTTASDTWEWDGFDWLQVFPVGAPTARAFYAMSYDERRGRTVTVGSQSTTNGSQVWEYDGLTWTQAAPATVIASRESPSMVYDKGRGVSVLFGGWNGSTATMYGDTWEWDGVDWRAVTTANAPAPRYRASMEYDTLRNRVVLYGGFGSSVFTDTWEYDGNDWTLIAANPANASSTEAIVGFHEAFGTMVTLGGSGPGGTNNQTWTYTGPPTPSFALYGNGAAGGLGIPALGGNATSIGQTLTIAAFGIPLSSTLGYVGLGISNTNWNGRPLPADLAGDGLPGCTLETSLDFFTPLPVVNGQMTLPLFIPNDPALVTLTFFCQMLVVDTSAANGICSMTRGGRVVIGN
ncbi:MAG TPA: hypothetical protein PKA37_08280 [Planctomycetota bacterium]|jgi:hypothetical protein|nr:hypothetical protein [Planctomycetota bacterium]